MVQKARIKPSPNAKAMGLVGKEGEVHGWTTPSVTNVQVIGPNDDDYAVAIFLEELKEVLWFSEEILEFFDDEIQPNIIVDV